LKLETTVDTRPEQFLGERYYVTFAWHEPSVCRLSSFVRSTQRLELFSNIFALSVVSIKYDMIWYMI